MVLDGAGNLYIADSQNSRIRKVDANGIIMTVAGNGFFSYYGDGEAAIDAALNDPAGVAMDKSGNLYIADAFNSRIRKIVSNKNIGIANGILSITNVATDDLGNYQVVVSSLWGSVTSSIITLNFGYPPVITSQPADLRLPTGTNAVLGVLATGTPSPAYQWLKNGAKVAGATNSSLTLRNLTVNNSGSYCVVVSNVLDKITSSNALLSVYVPDLTLPTLTLTTPRPAQRVSNVLFEILVKGTVKDNAGVSNVVCQITGGVSTNATVSGTNWSVTLPVNRGANSLGVYAVDTSANRSKTTNVSFVSFKWPPWEFTRMASAPSHSPTVSSWPWGAIIRPRPPDCAAMSSPTGREASAPKPAWFHSQWEPKQS